MDRKKVMSWLEGLAADDWRMFYSDSEVSNTAKAALELLKKQEPAPVNMTFTQVGDNNCQIINRGTVTMNL